MTVILDGKSLSAKILENVKNEVSKLEKKPSLAVILVGTDPASELYVSLKKKAAEKIGIKSEIITLAENIDESTLLSKVSELNNDPSTTAILVQLPLPKHLDEKKVIQSICPKKDVDGFTPENIGKISIGAKPFAYPCTPKGVIKILDEYNIKVAEKHAVIIGRSNIVGKPLVQMLLNRDATVTICHSKTKNLEEITKTADILISAVGKPKLVTADMVKPNAVIIDVGTNKVNGKPCGDVDFENVSLKTSYISPVPGGAGPMTIACLMENVLELCREA